MEKMTEEKQERRMLLGCRFAGTNPDLPSLVKDKWISQESANEYGREKALKEAAKV